MKEEQSEKGTFRFRKAERLHHKNLVDSLFAEGKGLYDFPLRLIWRAVSPEALEASFRGTTPREIAPLQMMVTIPKKKRRKAVDRVLMRRRIREAYRLNRNTLKQEVLRHPGIGTLSLAIVYIHNENADYARIEKKLIRLLEKVETAVRESAPKEKPCEE